MPLAWVTTTLGEPSVASDPRPESNSKRPMSPGQIVHRPPPPGLKQEVFPPPPPPPSSPHRHCIRAPPRLRSAWREHRKAEEPSEEAAAAPLTGT
ncbi:hypothetical protein N7530_004408 [Penicillium desertorum]|uniref:Uncharacterized protein n=1 Tax=Penicillium desertorum TaxID=1303715 RepID=A0A9W9WY28_9EURO|nr:hypothetical protein N7530_004408 [Penicillium desertorum]